MFYLRFFILFMFYARCICDANENFNSTAIEYENYLIARDYNILRRFYPYLESRLGKNLPTEKVR